MTDRAASVAPPGRLRRALEILPTAIVWIALTSPAWASLLAPAAFGYAMVLFSLYWLWKSAWFAVGLLVGWYEMRRAERRDWLTDAATMPGFDDVHHVVFVPTYKESDHLLAETLHQLAVQSMPRDRITVVLAFEERDTDAPARAARLTARYGSLFEHWLVTSHPDLPGEVKGKSSNLAWAARQVQAELVATGKLSADHLLITVLDADSRLHPDYLAALAHDVLSHPEGQYHLFQPALLFYANHWRLPFTMRASNSFYTLYEVARLAQRHRLVLQSTYSLAWNAAHAVDFWDVDVVPEDSHMCFKVLMHLGRRVRVRPIYLPVMADAAEGADFRDTVSNHYQQIRRWAWGISDVPYVVLGMLRAPDLPFYRRALRAYWYVEEHLLWPSHWFFLTFGGLVPALLNPAFAHSPLGMWQARLISTIFSLCLPCTLVVFFVDWRLRPRNPDGEDLVDVLLGWVGFLLLPLTTFVTSTLPALDAHTRLLCGRYLEYRVTEKVSAQERTRLAREGVQARSARRPRSRVRFEQLAQYGTYAPGSTTAVTDQVLLVYRDLR